MTAAQISTRRAELESALRQELPASMRNADLTHVTEHELVAGRRGLGDLRNECGCRTGEISMILALAVALGYIVTGHRPNTVVGLLIAVGEVGFALVAGGGIGKGGGILVARIRYVYRSRKLAGELR